MTTVQRYDARGAGATSRSPDQWDKVLGIGPISATLVLKPKVQAPTKKVNIAPSTLRIATPDEEEDVMEFCHELWDENGKDFFSFDPDKVRAILRRAFDKKLGMLAVIGDKGKLEAGALLTVDTYSYSSDWYLNEHFNYVRPAFRRSLHARTMVNWSMRMADQLGLLLLMGILSNHRTLAKVRLYRRIFPTGPAGCFFVYRPKRLYSDKGS